MNDRYVDLVDRHPDRFLAFVVLPLPHVDAALAELDRVLDAPGVVGVALTTSAAGRAVGADRLVLGSDFPYQGGEHYLDTVAYIDRAGLDAADTRGILADNAEALLGLA
ncbi:amidohydrolase family protein [Streptomyces scabiei]|uniref:amidohydrolase family protein n=1 Tax=Streptomyces scabiei TaxID=1930 RepID=UPI003F4D4FDF